MIQLTHLFQIGYPIIIKDLFNPNNIRARFKSRFIKKTKINKSEMQIESCFIEII